ncbi:MAG: AzlC family ABC transporter permease [Cyanophyceae cyanobacterium]
MSPRSTFVAGVKAIAPFLLGVVPFGTISGVAAVSVGLPADISIAMSFLIFAGASQLAAVQLMTENAPALVIILTALVINLRFVMYSASIAPHLQQAGQWKGVLAYLLTDQAYAVAITHFQKDSNSNHQPWYYLGAALMVAATWHLSTAVGVFLGTQVPQSWSLDFAIPLTFMSLAIAAMKNRAAVAAAIVAALSALLTVRLPYNLGLLVAAVIGILVGLLFEAKQSRDLP